MSYIEINMTLTLVYKYDLELNSIKKNFIIMLIYANLLKFK